MKNHRATLIIVVTTCFLLSLPMVAFSQNIEVDPLLWDFNDVVVGETATHEFTVSSIGPSTLQVYTYLLTSEADLVPYLEHDFIITGGPNLIYDVDYDLYRCVAPFELEQGESVNLEITYWPTSIGIHNAELLILSNDHDPFEDSQIYIHLSGNGVDSNPAPVPEPSSFLLIFTGLTGLVGYGKMKKFFRT